MIRYIIDTDVLTEWQLGNPRIVQLVNTWKNEGIGVSVISVEEQLSGWYTYLRRAKSRQKLALAYRKLAETTSFLARLPILTFSESAILHYQTLLAHKLNVGSKDLKIAAIVMEVGASLVTRNIQDFSRIPGLNITPCVG